MPGIFLDFWRFDSKTFARSVCDKHSRIVLGRAVVNSHAINTRFRRKFKIGITEIFIIYRRFRQLYIFDFCRANESVYARFYPFPARLVRKLFIRRTTVYVAYDRIFVDDEFYVNPCVCRSIAVARRNFHTRNGANVCRIFIEQTSNGI